MKKILSLVLVLIAIGHINAKGIEPNSPLGTSVIKKGALVKLFYRGEHSGKVKVTIYDENGSAVFKEVMQNREHFMRPYNFSSLPSGEYTIEIVDDQGTRTEKVEHAGVSKKKRPANLWRLNPDSNKYMLSVPRNGSDELVVKIYDERNSVIYEERAQVSGDFAKVYDLSQVKGAHTFEIRDNNGGVRRLSKPSRK
jgi:hypothetical protein